MIAAVCVALLALSAPAFVAFDRVAANTGVTKTVRGRSGTSLVSFDEHERLERNTGRWWRTDASSRAPRRRRR